MTFEHLIERVGRNGTVVDAVTKGYYLFQLHEHPICSVSGGSDSDIMLDLVHSIDSNNKVKYVFFNTGVEYEATKKHLIYLEKRYGITINKIKADIPVPLAVSRYGQPFLSKRVSEMIQRLQSHGFTWEDDSFENLYKRFPNCKSALKWWCNQHEPLKCGDDSTFNINRHRGLKEFMIKNPPWFKISNKCCLYAKKKLGHTYYKNNQGDLHIIGVRKAEGGARATSYKTCYSQSATGDQWRPLFWFTNKDKSDYENQCNIIHSDCYTKYGLKRTGCAGCPFGKNFEAELKAAKEYEPKLYNAVNQIFKDSYEYTRMYREFTGGLT